MCRWCAVCARRRRGRASLTVPAAVGERASRVALHAVTMGSFDTLFRLYLIVQWIFLSATIILFNKWLLSEAKFHFPLTIVIMHMAFVTLCAQLWRRMGWAENPVISWSDIGTRFMCGSLRA